VATEDAGAAYQSASILALGAQARAITTYSVLGDVMTAILYLRVPSIMEKKGSMKGTVLSLAVANSASWIPLILAMILSRHIGPGLMIALCAINLLPGRLLVPARDSWIASLVPPAELGNHVGWRTTINTATYLIIFFIMGHVLDTFIYNVSTGFCIVFSVAFSATLFSLLTYGGTQDHPKTYDNHNSYENQSIKYSFIDFLKEVKSGRSGKIVQYIVLLQAAVNLCSPLFVVYMINELNFSYLMYAAVIGSEFVGKILSSLFWGRSSDKIGDIPVVVLVSFIIPLVPLLWILSPNVIYLVIVQLLSGVAWAGYDISTWSWMHKNISPDKKPRYLTYVYSLNYFSKAAGASIGILLLGLNWQFWGSSILGLFFVSGILRFIIALFCQSGFRNMVETADQFSASEPNRANTAATDYTDKVYREGMYHRPELRAAYRKDADARSGNRGSGETGEQGKRGLLYRPQEWAAYRKDAEARSGNRGSGETDEQGKRGLLYRPQEWAAYRKGAEVRADTQVSGNMKQNQKQGLLKGTPWTRAPFFNPYSSTW